MESDARVYVASLADYNSGRLHGVWIDLDGSEDIAGLIEEMLSSSREPVAEEFEIHDHEGLPSGLVDRCTGIDELEDLAQLLAEHGAEAVSAASDIYSGDLNGIEGLLENGFATYKSPSAYAEEWIDSAGDLPEHYQAYFDFDAFGQALLHDVTWTESSGQVWVFCT